jgi:hypothetical protein
MISFEALIREHDELDAMAVALLALLEDSAIEAALAQRALLAAALSSHLEHEDLHVYPKLMACPDGSTAMTAQAFAEQFLDLAEHWGTHLSAWNLQAAWINPTAFRQATQAIIFRLRERIRQENGLLYPAALRASVITLRE